MRIVLVTNDFPPQPGGIQHYLANLIDVMDGDALVFAPRSPKVTEGESMGARVRVCRDRRRFMWPTARIRKWIISEASAFRPDAVLFGAPYPLPWMARRLGRELGVPTAVLCHGAEITVPSAIPVVRSLLRRSLRAADVLLAVSRYTARKVERLTRREVLYLGSGVDAELFHPKKTNETARYGSPVIGCVSRFVPRKGQQRLIRAVASLEKRDFSMRLLFVGVGRRLTSLQRLAARLNVDARFEVAVPFNDLPGLYREMDIFCMPCRSRWGGLEIEGLGIVYLEAAASGLPVLAGVSGGAPETVKPGETGFVAGSVRDIAEGLEMLLGDMDLAAEMGEAGRVFVKSEYSWSAVTRRLEQALEKAR